MKDITGDLMVVVGVFAVGAFLAALFLNEENVRLRKQLDEQKPKPAKKGEVTISQPYSGLVTGSISQFKGYPLDVPRGSSAVVAAQIVGKAEPGLLVIFTVSPEGAGKVFPLDWAVYGDGPPPLLAQSLMKTK